MVIFTNFVPESDPNIGQYYTNKLRDKKIERTREVIGLQFCFLFQANLPNKEQCKCTKVIAYNFPLGIKSAFCRKKGSKAMKMKSESKQSEGIFLCAHTGAAWLREGIRWPSTSVRSSLSAAAGLKWKWACWSHPNPGACEPTLQNTREFGTISSFCSGEAQHCNSRGVRDQDSGMLVELCGKAKYSVSGFNWDCLHWHKMNTVRTTQKSISVTSNDAYK